MSQKSLHSFLKLSLPLLCFISPSYGLVALKDSGAPAQTRNEADRGRVDPSMSISYARVVLKPSAEQSAALEQFLEEQRDPSSPNYQHWLTPEEFADRFSVSANDAAQVSSWLQSQGFTVESVARGRGWIAFSGAAAQFESAFETEIHHFRGAGELHFANTTPLSVPSALAPLISEIRGLHNYRWSPPRVKQLGPVSPDYTTSATSHYLAPDDLATIYDISPLYTAGFSGAGQKIVIVGQSDISLSDIAAFRARFNLLNSRRYRNSTLPAISSADTRSCTKISRRRMLPIDIDPCGQ